MATQPNPSFDETELAFCPVETRIVPRVTYAPQIPIRTDDQAYPTWCWAAVGLEMCRADKGHALPSNPTQAILVDKVLEDKEEPKKEAKLVQDVAWTLWRLHRLNWIKTRYRFRTMSYAQWADRIKSTIRDRGLPVSIVIGWGDHVTHNVCAHGYVESEDGSVSFWIYDPAANDCKSENLYLLSSNAFTQYPIWNAKKKVSINGRIVRVFLPE